jgi:hypothetical protein
MRALHAQLQLSLLFGSIGNACCNVKWVARLDLPCFAVSDGVDPCVRGPHVVDQGARGAGGRTRGVCRGRCDRAGVGPERQQRTAGARGPYRFGHSARGTDRWAISLGRQRQDRAGVGPRRPRSAMRPRRPHEPCLRARRARRRLRSLGRVGLRSAGMGSHRWHGFTCT